MIFPFRLRILVLLCMFLCLLVLYLGVEYATLPLRLIKSIHICNYTMFHFLLYTSSGPRQLLHRYNILILWNKDILIWMNIILYNKKLFKRSTFEIVTFNCTYKKSPFNPHDKQFVMRHVIIINMQCRCWNNS